MSAVDLEDRNDARACRLDEGGGSTSTNRTDRGPNNLDKLYPELPSSVSDEYDVESSLKPRLGSIAPSNISSHATLHSWESTIASRQAEFMPHDRTGQTRFLSQTISLRNHVSFSRRLYGRDAERNKLVEAWKEILSSRKAALDETGAKGTGRYLVTISGLSGTGKSSLAEGLRPDVQREGGFFMEGKFPQRIGRSRDSIEPYAAFDAACRDLCELVLSLYYPSHPAEGLNDDEDATQNPRMYFNFTLDEFRDKLLREIGVDVAVLTKVIPSLRPILMVDKSEANMGSIGYLEAQHQFKFAFRRFIRALTSFGPVVLTLDDLQWADTASMELLEALMSDRETTSIMVIGCYRTDETSSFPPHIKAIESVKNMSKQSNSLRVDSILVDNLSVDQVNNLLTDLLSSSVAETNALAACVHKKTLGNPFFVLQFITLLEDLELLQYSVGRLKWIWDTDMVQKQTGTTENVVNLVKGKMLRLPPPCELVLPMMACLGSPFEASIFELAFDQLCHEDGQADSHRKGSSARSYLSLYEHEGLIETNGSVFESFRWTHDRIQEAALLLMSEADLFALKQKLGSVLYTGLGSEGVEKNLFVIVNLLNVEKLSDGFISRVPQLGLARLNLRAGMKTMDTAAFEQATGYLAKGIELLPMDHWESEKLLSLELFSTAAEAEFCVGNFDRMRQYCNQIVSSENLPLLDKRRSYNLMIDTAIAEYRLVDALELSASILLKLGCRFPRRSVSLHVLVGMLKAKSTIKKIKPETISSMTPMEDPTRLWAMAVLDKFATAAYLQQSKLFALGIFRGLNWTLKYGWSEHSPAMFALIGVVLTSFLQDYEGGAAYADRSIELLNHISSARKVETRVKMLAHVLILHWSRPVHLSLQPLLQTYQLGMAVGDTESAARCIYFRIEFSFRIGKPLDALLADCSFYAEQLQEVKQLGSLAALRILWQCILNLSAENPNTVVISGEIMDQELLLRAAFAAGNKYLVIAVYRFQMYMAFVFGDYELVYELMCKMDAEYGSYEKVIRGSLGVTHLYAFNGLAMISLYRTTGRQKYFKLGKTFAAKVKRLANSGVRFLSICDSLP